VIPVIRLSSSRSLKLCNHQVQTPRMDTKANSPYHIGGIVTMGLATMVVIVNLAPLAKFHIQQVYDYIRQPVVRIPTLQEQVLEQRVERC